ncbi:MAG: excinuclease ABC subunit UvrA [Myxococcota bacterium]|nr:excinuclease ABC subunit UvrA [Myxococcota bacterium]
MGSLLESERTGNAHIVVEDAREHNLDGVSLRIPKRQLCVFTGPSGSGKSSLAFDTIFAESRRRFLDSLSIYARQFVGEIQRPKVRSLRGIGPSIAIDQRTVSHNPRSTVGTVTEIYDYVRVLWARLGTQHCSSCGAEVSSSDASTIVAQLLALPTGTRCHIFAPMVRQRKGEFKELVDLARKRGYTRLRVDSVLLELAEDVKIRKSYRHDIDLLIDRIKLKDGVVSRLYDSVQSALELGKGQCLVETGEGDSLRSALYSEHCACSTCSLSFPALTPHSFSFNSPVGMCPACEGLGYTLAFDPELVLPDPELSFAQGAIAAWQWTGTSKQERNPLLLDDDVLAALLRELGIDEHSPLSTLDEKGRRLLLFGREQPIEVAWNRVQHSGSYALRFDGILAALMQLYRSTKREALKGFLEAFLRESPCQVCAGARLRPESRAVLLGGRSIDTLNAMSIDRARRFFEGLRFDGNASRIANELMPEILRRLDHLLELGLDYLELGRSGPSLSGGESQRVRLATQLGNGLTGVTFVLDEPSIGLHSRDHERLLCSLQALRDRGNSVLVVEHDESTMRAADTLIDFGPGAGERGGRVLYCGPVSGIDEATDSLTAAYLSGRKQIETPAIRRSGNGHALRILGAREHNLRGFDVSFPLGTLICVTGVSGAGKSTLVNRLLLPAAIRQANRGTASVGAHDKIEGLQAIDRVIAVDQKPIGRTPRSNPATYTKVFDAIRQLFAQLPDSRIYGYSASRFSFNVAGGRCEACSGAGVRTLEMQFLADVYVPCESCRGRRFNEATLRVKYREHDIARILETSISDALQLFSPHPPVRRILQTVEDVGLGYLRLGQPSPTLSGGEAQRIKLSRELARAPVGHTLYVMDEPSTGLHFEDIRMLLKVVHRLVDAGNTVVIIEHNLEIIKNADYIIDLGPEGGDGGGALVAAGTPEALIREPKSLTGRYLAPLLASHG